jgi:hypothetical protein
VPKVRETKNECSSFVGKHLGKLPLGIYRIRITLRCIIGR